MFVMTESFDDSWDECNLTDDNLRELQIELLNNPTCGKVIQGTGGFRKMRFGLPGQGKRGGLRVIYVDFPAYEVTYLVLAYPKSEKDNLSKAEQNELKQISANIKEYLQEQHRKGCNNG
jgi:hypothetical protein